MHMANELLSVQVAAGTFIFSVGWLGVVCSKLKKSVTQHNYALMGILGAFIFAAQMVNFQLPILPGTSGHLVGAVLLAIIMGPHRGMVVLTSVVIIQCLIFQDGGILALGCNILNMAIVPSYIGYFIYRLVVAGNKNQFRLYLGSVLACVIGLEAGAVLVPIQVALSNVLTVPFTSFLFTMTGVHLITGIIEGVITAAVLAYLVQVRPQMLGDGIHGGAKLSLRAVAISLVVITIIAAGGLSLLASGNPDGLEWSYLERPDQHDFEPIVENSSPTIAAVDQIQSKFSLLPDYTIRTTSIGLVNEEGEMAAGWTSFAGVCGAFFTMLVIVAVSRIARRKKDGNVFNNTQLA